MNVPGAEQKVFTEPLAFLQGIWHARCEESLAVFLFFVQGFGCAGGQGKNPIGNIFACTFPRVWVHPNRQMRVFLEWVGCAGG